MNDLKNLDFEWENFTGDDDEFNITDSLLETDKSLKEILVDTIIPENIPKASEIYISTKTIIAFLTSKIILDEVFWKLPLINYEDMQEGIIKKQMKFISNSKEEFNDIEEKLEHIDNYIEIYKISHIEEDLNRTYKNIRKISIGLSKKDILTYRCKKKSAFYNCFVLIYRVKVKTGFKEIQIKVFNTGRLQIPGIQTSEMLTDVLRLLLNNLRSLISSEIDVVEKNTRTVLINSNFNCGYYLNRDKLFRLLKYKYNIHSRYDPCIYPGIQCKYYYDNIKCMKDDSGHQEGKDISKVSFMIFRTGSVLIVGKCEDALLLDIYAYIKQILHDEFVNIVIVNNQQDINAPVKPKKIRKKYIIIEGDP